MIDRRFAISCGCRRRRGLTLVEVLLSLTLLALVVSASTALLHTATRTRASLVPELCWRSAAQQVLLRMAEDVLSGDLAMSDSSGSLINIETNADQLSIVTRCDFTDMDARTSALKPVDVAAAMLVRHRYELESNEGKIRRAAFVDDSQMARRTLLEDVSRLEFVLHGAEADPSSTTAAFTQPRLSVTIESTSGWRETKQIRVAP